MTKTDWTAEEVRAQAKLERRDRGDVVTEAMLTAFAERIAVDEKGVPRFMTAQDEDMGGWLAASLDDPAVCTEMKLCVSRWMDQFTYPPAQPAQEQLGWKNLYILACDSVEEWKARALKAEEVSSRLMSEINEMTGPTFMGEPVIKETHKWVHSSKLGGDYCEICGVMKGMRRSARACTPRPEFDGTSDPFNPEFDGPTPPKEK